MALADLWALELLLAAFAGGAFGAALGALPSFSLAGFVVVLGEVYRIGARAAGVETLPVDVTSTIGFGVVLGPHVAFAGGAAAVAYAAKRGYLDGDTDYHQAKDITRGLGARPDVLAVGGAFGVVGYWVATLAASLSAPVDPVALGVVGSALAHRVALGYSVVGAHPRNWFDMSPFEQSGDALPDGGRTVEPWLPYQYRWGDVLALGVVAGVLGAYTAYVTASPFLAFGVSALSLAFLSAGVAEIPVTHHVTLPASTAVLALVDTSGPLTPAVVAESVALGDALLVGALFGAVGALLGEVAQRVFYAHAETHLDPPAASIVATSFLLAALSMVGVLPSAVWIPTP